MTRRAMNIAGKTFNSLTAIKREFGGIGGVHWLCECVCGRKVIATASQLTRGTVTRCKECRSPSKAPKEKACVRCGKVLAFTSEFFVMSPQFKFGLRPVCKPCYNPRARVNDVARRKAMRLEVLTH